MRSMKGGLIRCAGRAEFCGFLFRNSSELFRNVLAQNGTVLRRREKKRKEKIRPYGRERNGGRGRGGRPGRAGEQGKGLVMDGDGAEEAGAGQHEKAGRALVRALLVGRLAEAGLTRAKGQTEAALAAMQDRLCDWLGYMRPDNLRTLAEEVLLAARDGRWPAEVVITGLAQGIEPKPMGERRIVTSWFTSVEGPSLLAQGLLVETYRFLHRAARPPLVMDQRLIREEADKNNRRARQIRDWQARGVTVGEGDLVWLADYEADLARLTALVAEGQERRLAGVQG
jgi:hypothetical protein